MSKFEAVIFDMDGTIIDSEVFAYGVWKAGLASFGFELKKEVFTQMVGRSAQASNLVLASHFPTLDPILLRKKVRELEPAAYESNPITEKNGATQILNYLKDNKNIKIGLATSTEKSRAEARLSRLNLIHYFDEMVFGDQVTNHKPDPEIYLTVATRLGVSIENCLIVEDSEPGVAGALSSKAKVIWIRDMLDISSELKQGIYLELNSLHEIKSLFSEEN